MLMSTAGGQLSHQSDNQCPPQVSPYLQQIELVSPSSQAVRVPHNAPRLKRLDRAAPPKGQVIQTKPPALNIGSLDQNNQQMQRTNQR